MKCIKHVLIICCVMMACLGVYYKYNFKYSDELSIAILSKDCDKVDELLSWKLGNVNSVRSPLYGFSRIIDFQNFYPLQIAARSDLDTVNKLLKKGAKVNVVDPYIHSTPVICALESNLGERYEIAELFIKKGADIDIVDDINRTALNSVVKVFDTDTEEERKKGVWLLDYLLKNCKDIQELEEKSGSTPLFIAAGYNNVDAVKYLIENNFYDVNSQVNGMTILMKAAQRGACETCEYLLNKDANLEIVSSEGKTAYDFAKENGNEAICKLLEQASK